MIFASFRLQSNAMEENLLFFSFVEKGDEARFGYLLYDPSLHLLESGENVEEEKAIALIESNVPICYDLLYFSSFILSLYEKVGKEPDREKRYFDLYALYRYKRHLHFYVDILECLRYMGKIDCDAYESFDYESANAKDYARLSRQVLEGLSQSYDASFAGALKGKIGWTDLSKQSRIGDGLDRYADEAEADFASFLDRPRKRFLFLDIECSNTDYCEGKICEFSYCLFDNEWNLIEKKEILLNPGEGEENDFKLLGRPDSRDLHLQYEEDDYKAYRDAEEFPFHEKAISELLFDPDTVVLGYEVESDLRFLAYTYARYGIKMGRLTGIDVKRIYEEVLGRTMHSLGDLVGRFVPSQEAKSLRFHAAIDDAYATGLVLKYFLLLKDMRFIDLLEQVDSNVVCEASCAFYSLPDLIDEEVFLRLEKDGLI